MSTTLAQALGWVATCVFVASYFFARAASLRAAQMAGAAIWIAYGFLIDAKPVIAANALVLAAAALTAGRARFNARRAAVQGGGSHAADLRQNPRCKSRA